MHAFQVPRQTSQGPFAIDRLQSTDMEPPEPHYFLDNPKHRLHRGFDGMVRPALFARPRRPE